MRAAVIGCGLISKVHLATILSIPDVSLVAVCDVDTERAQRTADKFGVERAYSDPMVLLQKEKLDVVHVLTPPSTHAALAVDALQAGCNVLVEKPMALSTREADRMMDAAHRARKIICVDHSRLFDPLVLGAKKYIAQGALGQLVGVDCFQGFPQSGLAAANEPSNWISTLELGVIQDLVPHAFAFMLEFAGGARDLHVVLSSGRKDGPTYEGIRVIYGGQILGTIAVSLSTQPFLCSLTLFGTSGTIEIDFNSRTLLVKKEMRGPAILRRGLPGLRESWQLLRSTVVNAGRFALGKLSAYPGVDELVRRFYSSLMTGAEPPITAEQGREVVRLMEAMAQSGREIVSCAS